MAQLASMPAVQIDQGTLRTFGGAWQTNGGSLARAPPRSSNELAKFLDRSVAEPLATLLGGLPIFEVHWRKLLPREPDCVETGQVRIVGGVRPQAFDVGYRPDGPRFLFDSKTLNDSKSVRKNWQNMINDLATEATSAHSRFPFCVVAFLVAIPEPCVQQAQLRPIVETLERLAGRDGGRDQPHMAEAVSLILWRPADGSINGSAPAAGSPLRIEKFSSQIEAAYVGRYKGLPPHV